LSNPLSSKRSTNSLYIMLKSPKEQCLKCCYCFEQLRRLPLQR
jgi:hypothetical protein